MYTYSDRGCSRCHLAEPGQRQRVRDGSALGAGAVVVRGFGWRCDRPDRGGTSGMHVPRLV